MADTDIPRPWLDNYPPGVTTTLDMSGAPSSVVDILQDTAAKWGDRPALESFGVQKTYKEFADSAEQIAASLQKIGLKKGDRAAIMTPNIMAYPPLIFGILMAGGIVVNVNPLYTPRELTHQLNDAGARVIFVLENFAHTVEAALGDLKTIESAVVLKPGDMLGIKGKVINFVSRVVKRAVPAFRLPTSMLFVNFYNMGDRAQFVKPEMTPDDVAFLQYTGGTTGVSKGAVLSHRNIVANVLQCEGWMLPFLGERDDHVVFTALPLYHILALTACCLLGCRIGGCQILIANPRDIPGLIKLLKTRPPTILVLVNTLYNVLSLDEQIKNIDFSKLATSIAGGMATQAAVSKRWQELTGKPIIEGYGLSETSPVACVNRLDTPDFTGAVGYPVASTDIMIRTEDGGMAPVGEAGEVCIKGPQVMSGYWQRADETEKVMTDDGFFRSGDIGILQEDGLLKLVDRMKDMIVVSGMKVFPNEVEEVLAAHPGILEAAVIGIPDAHSGEVVSAYVVAKGDEQVPIDELRAYARENLTSYKMPKQFEYRDTLPKTNVGKILRRELREEVLGVPE